MHEGLHVALWHLPVTPCNANEVTVFKDARDGSASVMQRVPGLPPRLPLPERPSTGGRENRDPLLLRCFVRRELGGERAVAKFQLYLGSEHNEPDSSKFLMAALLTSRCTYLQVLGPAYQR